MDEDKKPFALEYLKSALSVNSHVGCILKCSYCVLDEFASGGIEEVYTPTEALDILLSNRLFIPGKTPITLNNRTDPLLPVVKPSTLKMVKLLNERGIENPRVMISKIDLKKDDLELLEDSCAETYFFVTYSNLPSKVERVPHELQRRSLETLSKRRRVHALHYWRPLIKGLNDKFNNLETVLTDVSKVCEGSVLSGLRLNSDIARKVVGFGGDISGWTGDTKHKYLPGEIIERILELRDEVSPKYPLYRHTSCAISSLQDVSDYNFHFLKSSHCLPQCPNVDNCGIPKKPSKRNINYSISRLGLENRWHYENKNIIIEGSINEEERSCISHLLGYPVIGGNLTKTSSEQVLRK